MKLLFAIITIALSLSATAQTLPDYSKLSGHPRLIIKQGDVASVRKKVANDQPLRSIHCVIEERANGYLSVPVSKRIKTGKRLLSISRNVFERVCYCSYMYLVEGEESYARRAEQEMLAAASFTDWNPSHFLDVAEMTAALAIGYDWLYDWLSAESRKTIEDAIIEKGLRAANPKMWWYRSDNNWNQVCNCGMVMGALAVFERVPDEAKLHIERALSSNPKVQTCYGPDGVYPEGFGYWEYGTWFEVMLIESLRTAIGNSFDLEKAPGFLESAKFMNFMQTPTGAVFNFSDSGNPMDVVNPLLYWFALETGDMSLVWQDRERIKAEESVRGINRQAPIAMLFAARCNIEKIEPIKEQFWAGQGKQPLFIYRSGFDSYNNSYLAAKGGTPKSNHGHMDSGSFIYEWGGVQWASDLGMQSYHSLESKGLKIWNRNQNSDRWRVYRLSNYPHNTLTINGKLHQVDGFATMDKIIRTKRCNGARFDLSSLFIDISKAYRTIYIDDKDKVTCIDELQTHNKRCEVCWNMTTTANATIIDDNTISLKKWGKEIVVRLVAPKGGKAYIKSNDPQTSYDVTNRGTRRIGFTVTIEPESRCKLKVELEPQK